MYHQISSALWNLPINLANTDGIENNFRRAWEEYASISKNQG